MPPIPPPMPPGPIPFGASDKRDSTSDDAPGLRSPDPDKRSSSSDRVASVIFKPSAP